MANPLLTDEQLRKISDRGAWAPPDPNDRAGYASTADDTVSPWERSGAVMTTKGTITATAVLFALFLPAAVVGYLMVPEDQFGIARLESWIIVVALVGFGVAMFASFKPQFARILGPIYALVQGVFVGAISHAYESRFEGIVLQAAGATAAVFGVMLFLHASGMLKVTNRMRRVVTAATMGLMLFYLVSIVINMFTSGGVSFIHSASPLGIGFSVLVVILAAFNLSLDFDTIERGVAAPLPKQMEWMCALGLVVTIVWLYLEILRLLSKLQSRN